MLKKSTTLYCFSPPVMLATFILEITLLFIVVAKLGLKTKKTRVVAGMILLLALFQMAEYYVCGGLKFDAKTWAHIGFVVITLLPPMGLYLAYLIHGHKSNLWRVAMGFAWLHALIWVSIFQFARGAFHTYECAGNYAIFQLGSPYGGQYFAYYYGWLFLTILLAFYASRIAKPEQRKQLHWLIIGYGVFLIPTGITNMVKPETIRALPSVMCGFAVLLAIILVFGVLGIRPTQRDIDKSH